MLVWSRAMNEVTFRKRFAKAMRSARVESGIPQTELSDQTGITQENISRYERGQRMPGLWRYHRIALVLGRFVELGNGK